VILSFDRFINRANSRRHYNANIVTQIASVVVCYSSRNTEYGQLSGRGVNLVQNVCGGACVGGLGDRSPPVGSRGEAPVGDLGDEVPQKLKQF